MPEFGQCVHKVARDAGDPERLYLQHHGGIYRSRDGGRSWQPMTSIAGMDFGFPIVAHPSRAGTAYVLPLESDEYRCTPAGRCTVWRTGDGGTSWEPLTTGLPQGDAHLTVLRDAFTTDGQTPAGLYFGTRSGEVYGSTDDGETGGCWPSTFRPSCRCGPPRWPEPAMEVRVRVPTPLRELVAGERTVVVDVVSTESAEDGGTVTVGSVLDALAIAHPALERRVRDERGRPRVHVNLFVGADNVRDLDGLATPIAAGRRPVDHPCHLGRLTAPACLGRVGRRPPERRRAA